MICRAARENVNVLCSPAQFSDSDFIQSSSSVMNILKSRWVADSLRDVQWIAYKTDNIFE